MSDFLDRLPEFLKKEKENANESLDLLSRVSPNSVNLCTTIMEKLHKDLDKIPFNDWSTFNNYIGEFKLDEVFKGVKESFFNIKTSELLKGFFIFKGTQVDIQYLMKIAGYLTIIYDSTYFYNHKLLEDLLLVKYRNLFESVLMRYSLEEIFAILRSQEVLVVNNAYPLVVDNQQSLVVVNRNHTLEEILISLGLDVSESNLQALEEILRALHDSFTTNLREYDCALFSDIYVDLDKADFGGLYIKDLIRVIKEIIQERILICVYLRAIEIYLSAKDIVYRSNILEDTQYDLSNYSIDSTLVIDPLRLNESDSLEVMFDFSDILERDRLVNNKEPIIVNNVSPIIVGDPVSIARDDLVIAKS